jgi:branched-chain amino acid transport system ATP-binding protein
LAALPRGESTPGSLLQTRDLASGYGRVQTLYGVSIEVPADGVTLVIGPNGSGKSTLLKTVMGLVKAWSGQILFEGSDISRVATHDLVRRGICMVPQGRVVFPLLSVEENLSMSAFSIADRGVVRQRIEEAYDFLPLLKERRRQAAGSLSGGEQVMLSLAKVVMLKPRLLMLDEPSLGLSPKLVELVYEKVAFLADGGLATILVEQNVRKGLSVADHVVVLTLGQVRFGGRPDRLEAEVDLGRLFLEGHA